MKQKLDENGWIIVSEGTPILLEGTIGIMNVVENIKSEAVDYRKITDDVGLEPDKNYSDNSYDWELIQQQELELAKSKTATKEKKKAEFKTNIIDDNSKNNIEEQLKGYTIEKTDGGFSFYKYY
ncbi:MAG: hypothetical protein AABW89_05870 [Nanoarchaeota archaeon]